MGSVDTDGIVPEYDEQSGYDGRYPPDWDARRKAIQRRDDWTCTDCGIKSGPHASDGGGVVLDVHHTIHLSDGGSNRPSNLTTLCVDCHNDRHDHDIKNGRDGYASDPGVWDRLRRLLRAVVGGVACLPIHGAGIYILLTQVVGSTVWFVGAGYLVLLAVALLVRPGRIAALYTVAGAAGTAIVGVGSVPTIGTVSTAPLALTAWIPVVLAIGWYRLGT